MPDAGFLARYAQLAVQTAIPIQPGHQLLIVSPPEAHAVVQAIAIAAYAAGAAAVDALYEDSALLDLTVRSASEDRLRHFPPWTAQALTEHARAGHPILTLHAPAFHSRGQALTHRAALATAARNAALEHYGQWRSRMTFNWSVMAVATPGWATFLRPDLAGPDALDWLWHTLAHLMRLDTPDLAAAWQEHAHTLGQRCAALDALNLTQLHFTGPGTSVTIGLPAGHTWFGPRVTSAQGLTGVPNLPTEEISTLPHRLQTDGYVRMTRPLVLGGGQVIEELELTFAGGRVTGLRADTGEAALRELLGTDDGASRLGEVALVSEDALVAQARRTFYSTLIDENASCHLALGRAYPVTLRGGSTLDAEAFEAAGGNHSRIHIDFMVGSPALSVTGLTQGGASVQLMQRGQWVPQWSLPRA